MTHIDTGTQGAKRQSWHHGPRELLLQIIDEMGVDDHGALLEEFYARTEATTPIQKALADYFFSNHLHYLLRQRSGGPSAGGMRVVRAKARARAEQVSKIIVKRVKLAADQMLLDWVLPSGKPLRDSTGGECLAFGGWLSTVGSRMKPDQTVGEVFKEKQLRDIWRARDE
jgi:hypothetical protein